MRKLNYAVLGLGIGRSHARGAAAADNCNLCAVCDLRQDRLDEMKALYPDILTYTDYEQMLSNPDIDIVSVATPSGMHSRHAVMALEAGKHVLCEKPIDINMASAMEIEKARLRTGLKVGVIFQNRLNAVMKPFKEAVVNGRLGKIFSGNFRVMWRREQDYYDKNGGWHGTWNMDGGGSLMNQSIHTVDIMQWLMGDVESVMTFSDVVDHDIETEDFTSSLIKFTSGAAATFTTTTCAWPGFSTDIQINGTRGGIWIDGGSLVKWKLSGDPDDEEQRMLGIYGKEIPTALISSANIPGHDYQVWDMADAVLNDRDPMITPYEAMKSLKIILAMYESSRTGRPVRLAMEI